jgi:hypothetical protein
MTSKIFKGASIAATAAALALGAVAASANTVTFQNVTFTTTAVDANTFTFTMTNALNANGDWAGITNLGAFAFKNAGTITDGDVTDWTTDTFVAGGLADAGCNGAGAGWGCFNFVPDEALTNNMTFTIHFDGSGFDTDGIWSLKIQMMCTNQNDVYGKCGSLFSAPISSGTTSSGTSSGDVPEPGPVSLTLLGLGLLGAGYMRRAKQAA